MTRSALLAVTAMLLVATGCGSDPESSPGGSGDDQRHPDIVEVQIEEQDGSYSLEVTVSSPYDSPERYADGWRVLGPDDTVHGEHRLLHDHAGEQPFTRTQTGVEIPDDVDEVTVQGRDQEHGYGGATVTVAVPR
ncbi:hypothetical protein KUV85_08470 [Nocardioides panacisoli]|uniref:hypothetical protein n=1 Tax=Nocardioides panacisoli TaxID=627624 RepID=UPI001C632BDC|nr:hypothetical protein [Nocardioides panacisoli]QYJ05698.1 hypothetical protein KUV85_08470 [Nocardioides panacisoli]